MAVGEYTVEHILPQNENLSAAWRTDLGSEWKQVQMNLQHTLGNLTLTAYNSEYGDRPFVEKRDMLGGFRHSPLRLNQELQHVEVWNEYAIMERSKKLAKHAVEVWNSPKLDESTLAAYRPKTKLVSEYDIDDHSNLKNLVTRSLFEAFRKEVLALHVCINEEWLKQYVAYKAETNIVDVIPLSKRLRIILNIRLSELDDPKNKCRDISKIGHWGNGHVEVSLSTLEDLPYVIGLVRQALEKQL